MGLLHGLAGRGAPALYGSGLTKLPTPLAAPNPARAEAPGEYYLAAKDLLLNKGRATVAVEVVNMGDRPAQVGSHYPFFETNAALHFDRAAAYGFRLNILAGTEGRFEPGECKRATLVALSGELIVYGGNEWIDGKLGRRIRS